jgi:hypothetical protein
VTGLLARAIMLSATASERTHPGHPIQPPTTEVS